MSQMRIALAGMVLAASAVPGIAHAAAKLSFASGVDYSSGDYGTDFNTEVLSVPLSARLSDGPWTLRAATSYLEIRGPADVADPSGASGGAFTRTGTASGVGDTNLSLEYTFRRLGGTPAYLETTARVRLPTGDADKGLGVGATDYGLSGEVGVNARSGGASLEITRRFLGDRTDVDRRDGWQANAAAWWRPTEQTQIGAFGFWREASVAGAEDPAQAGAYASYRLLGGVRISLSESVGLSHASADYTTSLRLTWQPGEN